MLANTPKTRGQTERFPVSSGENRKTFRLSPGLKQFHAEEFSGILAELLTLRVELLRHAV
jgi:hypothetical protein